MQTGYYWAENETVGFPFIVFHDGGYWYICGFAEPIDLDPNHVVCGPLDYRVAAQPAHSSYPAMISIAVH